jgi:hypothetical protein
MRDQKEWTLWIGRNTASKRDNSSGGKVAEAEFIRAFLDESGTHAGSQVTTIAGYLISSEALPLLEDSWLAVLKKHGMVELHMKEFVPPHGKLSRWSEKQKRAVLEPLIDLIHERSLVGIGAAVEMTEFMTTSRAFAHSKSPDLVESPYQWCLRYCMVQAGAWAEKAGSRDQLATPWMRAAQVEEKSKGTTIFPGTTKI